MQHFSWQLINPINTIVFDCDGTLSSIEGIDELAKNNETYEAVQALTEAAMSSLGMNLELYEKRLQMVQPTHSSVRELAEKYYLNRVPDIEAVLQIYQQLNKTIYVVSAGLYLSVALFAERLGIPKDNIIAVKIEFDETGFYTNFEKASPLVTSNGKRIILNQIKATHQDLIFVGDGMNDIVAMDVATRFIGYGGIYYRKTIAERCQFYITTPSLSSLLPLTLTNEEYASLSLTQKALYQQGLEAIQRNQVAIS